MKIVELDHLFVCGSVGAPEAVVSFVSGHEHVMEVAFDGKEQGKAVDCRPGVPLVLRW